MFAVFGGTQLFNEQQQITIYDVGFLAGHEVPGFSQFYIKEREISTPFITQERLN